MPIPFGCRVFTLVTVLACCSAPVAAQGTLLVSGTLRDNVTNEPLINIPVRTGYRDGSFFPPQYIVTGTAVSDATGAYRIDQPAGGSPGVQFIVAGGNGYVQVIYPNTVCYQEGTCMPPQAQSGTPVPATNRDFLLPKSATLEGQALRTVGGAPVANALVVLNGDVVTFSAITDAEGRFRRQNVIPDNYFVSIRPAESALLPQIHPSIDFDATRNFNDAAAAGAPRATLVSGLTHVANFSVNPSACIRGSVRSARDGSVVQSLLALKREGLAGAAPDFRSLANITGNYEFGPLIPGTLRVQLADARPEAPFFPNYYNNATSPETSELVQVNAGPCREGVDALLVPRHSISGTVRDAATGAAIANVGVDAMGHFFTSMVNASATTDASGRFTLQGFARSNTFGVRANPIAGYTGEFYLDLPHNAPFSSWTRVDVAADEHRTSIDFTLAPSAFVTGRVFNRPAGATSSVAIQALGNGTPVEIVSSVDAAYFFNLAPGNYRVIFRLGGTRWAHPGVRCTTDACDEPGASVVSVTELREYAGYDFDFSVLNAVFKDQFE